jgi:hypothetical protein
MRSMNWIRDRLPLWIEVWLPLRPLLDEHGSLNVLQSKLPNGQQRFCTTSASMRGAWCPDVMKPSDGEWFVTAGVKPMCPPEIYDSHIEERELLLDVLKFPEDKRTYEWMKRSKGNESYRSAMKNVLTADFNNAYAVAYWKDFAIPFRFHNGFVYRIWAAHEIYYPIVKAMKVEDFLVQSTINSAKQEAQIERLQIQRDSIIILLWIVVAAIAITV